MPAKERPILFSGEMVRAIMDGRKWQTRRIVKKILGYREFFFDDDRKIIDAQSLLTRRSPRMTDADTCPYGTVGDSLWVRESFATRIFTAEVPSIERRQHYTIYRADSYGGKWDSEHWHDYGGKWKPSIHMPRWASRLTLEVTAVRVERLQDIIDDDCYAEGIAATGDALGNPRAPYRDLWNHINSKRIPWVDNPWVWVIEFKRLESSQ